MSTCELYNDMTWKERAEKAEAALATEKVAREKAEADLTHILTSCGKGWVSPETHAELKKRWDRSFSLNTQLSGKLTSLQSKYDAALKLTDRCTECNAELSQCGTPNVDGEPSMNCMECKLRDSLAVAKSKLSAAVDGLGIIHSHFVVHTQVCADKSCWKCYIGKLAAQILDKIEE